MIKVICLNSLPETILELIGNQQTPIIIFWNSHIVFGEVYRRVRHDLITRLCNVEERPDAAAFFIKDHPAIRFLPEPELARRFDAKSIIDTSIYYGTLEKHPVEHIRQNEITTIRKRCNACGIKVLP